jgi:hypothetical protein
MIYPNEVIALGILFFTMLGFAVGWHFKGEYDESIEKRAQELRDRDIKERQMERLSARMDSNVQTEDIE